MFPVCTDHHCCISETYFLHYGCRHNSLKEKKNNWFITLTHLPPKYSSESYTRVVWFFCVHNTRWNSILMFCPTQSEALLFYLDVSLGWWGSWCLLGWTAFWKMMISEGLLRISLVNSRWWMWRKWLIFITTVCGNKVNMIILTVI